MSGYLDANIDSRKFTSGYIMTFARGAVMWQSRLRKCVSLSMTKVKYIAIIEGENKLLLMQEKFVLYCDSMNAIYLSKNLVLYSRLKHIDVNIIGFERIRRKDLPTRKKSTPTIINSI